MTPATYVVRVWIPDRPGALGQVASRIGAARGDVAGIEILERGGGRAIDEIVVELPSADLLDTLIRQINEVEGVDVEDVRAVEGGHIDPWLDALDTASQLVGAGSAEELLEALADHAYRGIGATWVAVAALDGAGVHASRGPVPTDGWLHAFLEGSRHSARNAEPATLRDVCWSPLPAAGVALILGRDRTAFRAKERHQVAALARIADAWLCGLQTISRLSCRLAHPSMTPSSLSPRPVAPRSTVSTAPPLDART
ncbi:MAG: ACT domain-containing protein [Acidimicrobiia bacterium]